MKPRWKSGSSTLPLQGTRSVVREYFQLRTKVDVANNHVAWSCNERGSEIEDRPDAGRTKARRHILGRGTRCRNDAKGDPRTFYNALQGIKVTDDDAVDACAHDRGIDVDERSHMKFARTESLGPRERTTQVPDANDGNGPAAIEGKGRLDPAKQMRNVISRAARAG